jgi:hypothetical protein
MKEQQANKNPESVPAKKPGARWRAAEKWAMDRLESEGRLEDKCMGAIWQLCNELRTLEQSIHDDSQSIARDAMRFADNLLEYGATHSSPSGYRRYDDLQSNINVFESKIASLFLIIPMVFDKEAKAELRSVLGVK